MAANPRAEMDDLLDFLVHAAQELLSKRDEFFPIAACVQSAGEMVAVAGETEEEHPLSSEIIDLLYEALCEQAGAGEIGAAAVGADVLVEPPSGGGKTDAIRVDIEHAEADPVRVFLP